ncbi:MAG: fluoride efflux transporter CrcB [Marmoricola sp.]
MRPHHPRELLAIFIGGAIGALLRALLAQVLVHEPRGWPWPTFVANLAAAFLLGWIGTLLMARHRRGAFAGPFWAAGLCGGLSTFSTVQVELVRLVDSGDGALALSYLVATVAWGLVLVHLGTVLARRRLGRAAPGAVTAATSGVEAGGAE